MSRRSVRAFGPLEARGCRGTWLRVLQGKGIYVSLPDMFTLFVFPESPPSLLVKSNFFKLLLTGMGKG